MVAGGLPSTPGDPAVAPWARPGAVAPWVEVLHAVEVETTRRRGRAPVAPPGAWRWRLTLACGHFASRPCRERKVGGPLGGTENVPAPRRVRCLACQQLARAAVGP